MPMHPLTYNLYEIPCRSDDSGEIGSRSLYPLPGQFGVTGHRIVDCSNQVMGTYYYVSKFRILISYPGPIGPLKRLPAGPY